jgi:hypothetical protein
MRSSRFRIYIYSGLHVGLRIRRWCVQWRGVSVGSTWCLGMCICTGHMLLNITHGDDDDDDDDDTHNNNDDDRTNTFSTG